MRCVGLDPSLTSFGGCDDAGVKVIGGYSLKETAPHRERIRRLVSVSSAAFQFAKGAELVAMEDHAYSRNVGHAHERAEVYGVIHAALWQSGTPFIICTIQHVKKFATGKAGAPKDEVLAAAIRQAEPPHDAVKNFDEADAYWLWRIAKAPRGPGDGDPEWDALPIYRKEVLEAVFALGPIVKGGQ